MCFTTPLAFPKKQLRGNWSNISVFHVFCCHSVPCLFGLTSRGFESSVFCFNNKVSPRTPLTSPIFELFAICYLLIAPARQRLCVLHHRHICQVSDFNWVLAFLRKRRCFWSPLRVGFPCIFPLLLTHLLPHSPAWTLGLSGALHWDSDSFWCLVDIFLTSWAIPCAQAY